MSTEKSATAAIIPNTIPVSKVVSVDQETFNNDGRIAQTVPPYVVAEHHRIKNSDYSYGNVLILFYFLFLTSSIWVFVNAHPKYKVTEGGVKTISDYYYPEVEQCCASIDSTLDRDDENLAERQQDGLCSMIHDSQNQRYLEEADRLKPKLLGDEGIFDAFLERPDIILFISMVIITFTVTWVYLLQRYTKPVVIVTEVIKALGVVIVGAYLILVIPSISYIFILSIVLSYGTFVFTNIEEILKASKVIKHSVTHIRKNAGTTYKLLTLKIVYCLQTALLLITLCTSYEIVEVRPFLGSCYFVSPGYMKYLNSFQITIWMWAVWTLDMVRLFIVAYTTGTSYFGQNGQDGILTKFSSILRSALTKSFGTLVFAGLVTSFLDLFRKRDKRCFFWFGPQIVFFAMIEMILCLFGSCLLNLAYVWTKFSVIIHAFQGTSFQESSKRCSQIMRRRFFGGYITEFSSSSVLWLSSVFFSCSVALISWGWFDASFNCSSFEDSSFLLFPIIMGILFMHPVFGVLAVIGINMSIQKFETYHYENGLPTYQHLWVPPLAAAFVGFATKLVFTYMGGIILDAVDTMLLCFAIDEDNGVQERSQDEFTFIVKDMKEYIKADPVVHYDIEAKRISSGE